MDRPEYRALTADHEDCGTWGHPIGSKSVLSSKEHYQKNPDPLVFQEENLPKSDAFVLSRVTAVLCGRKGRLEFEFSALRGTTGRRRMSSRKAEDLLRKRIRPLYSLPLPDFKWVEGHSKSDVKSDFFSFSPESGKPLAATAISGFMQGVRLLFPSESPAKLPLPTTVSRHFWLLGEERVPFDAALALDEYMDGGFRKVRQTYKAEGQRAAYRLYSRLYRTLRNDELRDKNLGDFVGAEILVGKNNSYDDGGQMGYWEFCVNLIIDGFEVSWPKWVQSHTTSTEVIPHVTRWCTELMKEFGIDTYKLTQGERTRHDVLDRVCCDKPDDDELRMFTGEMLKGGCRQFK